MRGFNATALRIGAIVAVVGLVLFGQYLGARPEKPKVVATKPVIAISTAVILEDVNRERVKAQLQPLYEDSSLNKSAKAKCDDMVAGNYYDHVNPVTGKKGSAYINDALPELPAYYAENLNLGYRDSHHFISSWMDSEGHRETILNPDYVKTGLATCKIAKYPDQNAVVQHFASHPECPTMCNDGYCSESTGQGTCSWHDGIAE